ncbi:hypothetical protein TYRP_006709 [Tyrophagus putrescentiae]|nr:hypothetical protein TYRP_006709 [Tyrophagus putrescentiae]
MLQTLVRQGHAGVGAVQVLRRPAEAVEGGPVRLHQRPLEVGHLRVGDGPPESCLPRVVEVLQAGLHLLGGGVRLVYRLHRLRLHLQAEVVALLVPRDQQLNGEGELQRAVRQLAHVRGQAGDHLVDVLVRGDHRGGGGGGGRGVLSLVHVHQKGRALAIGDAETSSGSRAIQLVSACRLAMSAQLKAPFIASIALIFSGYSFSTREKKKVSGSLARSCLVV